MQCTARAAESGPCCPCYTCCSFDLQACCSLFFFEQCGLGPIQISLLGTAGLLGVSAMSIAAQAISSWTGRVQLTLVTKVLDAGLLVLMAKLPSHGRFVPALLAIHLIRFSVANCSR